ncbi:hypothetical protein LP7551_01775 [Roseibium album]|nr:hypothetical protein LP7551_01775 [Roseibium album]
MIEGTCRIVGEGPVTVVDDRAHSAGCIHCESVTVRGVDIREVCREQDSRFFVRCTRDGSCNWCVVCAGDSDGHGFRRSTAITVVDGVSERVCCCFTNCQLLELTVWIVGEGAVIVVGDGADRPRCVDGEGVGVGCVCI